MGQSIGVYLNGILILILVCFLGVVAMNVNILNNTKSDGLIINLAGRQRLLTQKFTKETLAEVNLGKPMEGALHSADTTRLLFEKTQAALRNGGETFSDLAATKQVSIPLNNTEAIVKQLDLTSTEWSTLTKIADEILTASRAGNAVDAALTQSLMAQSNKTLAAMNKGVGMFQAASDNRVAGLYRTQTTGVILAIILGIVASVLLKRRVIDPLKNSLALARSVSDLDLSKTIDRMSEDEVGRLNQALNHMCNELGDIISGVSNGTQQINRTSGDLNQVSSNMNSSVQALTVSASSVAAAARQLSRSIDSIANSSEESSNQIQSVASAAEEMAATVVEIAQNADRVRFMSNNTVSRVSTANTQVGDLRQSAGEVGAVIQVIEEIAEQTKLLALNATIEAARAGESGKGFGVVANEVKSLAHKTHQATIEIRQKIDNIQSTTETTVKEISSINDAIVDVNELIRSIAAATEEQSITVKDVAQNITRVSGNVESVSRTVKEIASSTHDTMTNILQVDETGQNMSSTMTRVSQFARELETLGSSLQDIVNRFTLKQVS